MVWAGIFKNGYFVWKEGGRFFRYQARPYWSDTVATVRTRIIGRRTERLI